jgi:hypothetical protein
MITGGQVFDFIADLLGEVLLAIINGAIREYYLLAKKKTDEIASAPGDENEQDETGEKDI